MDQKPLRIFNVNEILAGLPLADLSRGVEQEDDADAFPMQAAFGSGGLFIGGFVGLAPWENHPDTDELLYAVEGEVEITILTDAGAQTEMLRQGCVCIVPKGLWHRQHAHAPVRLMTISGPSLSSRGDDPRPLTRRSLWRQHERRATAATTRQPKPRACGSLAQPLLFFCLRFLQPQRIHQRANNFFRRARAA